MRRLESVRIQNFLTSVSTAIRHSDEARRTTLSILGLRSLLMSGLFAISSVSLIPLGAVAQSGSSTFTAINVTGAGTGAHQGTVASAIDAAGDVAGIYVDSSGNEHAFVLPAGGAVTPFDASGTGGSGIETIPVGFDTAGDIVGIYRDASSRVHGFVRTASTGEITQLDVPGEDTGKMEGTFPVCINGSGEIAGNYSTTITTSSGMNSFAHGFVRSATGTITTFDAEPLPATYGSTNPGTFVISINASGEVAGFYIDGVGAEHGFLRDASGNISTFEAPNAATGSEQGTIVTGIDAAGDVIGAYTDSNNMIHGYVRSASTGSITVIDAPGAGTATYQGTYPDAIDAAGDISGSFTDANNVVHGFVLPAHGTITSYDAPGSITSDALLRAGSGRLNSKLRELGKSYSLSLKARRSNSPLMKLRSTLARVGTPNAEGGGLLNGSGANPSGTASYGNLILNGVNASGEIVGLFTDGDYVFHAFLRAANGAITVYDAPNAGTSSEQGTGGLAINPSGTIAGTYEDANSVLHGFVVTPAEIATTTTLSASQGSTVFGEPATFDATVSASSGTVPNGETVWFMNGTMPLGTATLSSGAASFTTTNLATGSDSITAVYVGDLNFSGSTSAAVSQTVNQASSFTTLKSSQNPSTFGQSVTFTANISGQFSGVATGTVTFNNGSTSLGTASVSNNSASMTITTLPVGTNSITAVYSGDSNFTGSTSNTVSQVVNGSTGAQPATSTALAVTSDGSPVASVTSGTVVTLTATVMTESAVVATGQVNFCDATATYCEDIHLLGAAQLTSNGTAAIKLRPGIGSHSYKAVFVGTTNDDASTSSASPLTVTNGSGVGYPTTTTIAQSGAAGNYTLTATVTGSVDRSGLASPSGTVSFLDTSNGNALIGSAVLTDGTSGLNWRNSQSMVPGYDPTAIAVADFNQDGIPDLAVYNFDYGGSNTSISIFLGKGDGTFTTAASPATPTGAYAPDRFVVGDFNQDGIPDLAVINYQGQITIFLGKGDGTFNAMSSNVPGTWGNIAAVGDFDGDGIPDLVVAGSTPFEMGGSEPAGSLTILAGKGDGTFTQSASPAITGLGDLVGEAVFAAADLNGDGNLDLALVNQSANSVSTLLSNGNGTFTQLATTYPTGTVPYGVAVADFNGDGIPDLVISSDQGIATVLLGKGDGTFTAAPSITVALPENAGVATADFNQDGKVDLVFAGANGSALVYLGNGNGTFTLSQYVSAGDFQWGVAVGDFNGDGVPDFALTMRNESTTSLGASSVWVELTQLTTSATASASSLSVSGGGQHLVVGSYAGDNNYASAVSQAISLNGPAATPTFSVPAGTYTSAQTVTISDATSGAAIYFTTNGTTPTTSSTLYTGPINVSSSETIEAIATATGYSSSAVAIAAYTINIATQAATPTFSPVAGTYTSAQSVTISDATEGATIYYTINGTAPTTGSSVYGGPITVSSSQTLEAIATASGYSSSAVASAAYVITSGSGSLNQWTWIGGSNNADVNCTFPSNVAECGQSGVYGTLGSAAASNNPGGREYGATWTDKSGNLWLFGGKGYDANATFGLLNDLWEFNPSTSQWTWKGGSNSLGTNCPEINYVLLCGQSGVYGTLHQPAAGNIPGGRSDAASWTDANGDFWLFGGLGFDSQGNWDFLNDLWEFNPSTSQWAWMGGSNTVNLDGAEYGVYGTLGTPSPSNIPGGRLDASSWTDRSGNLWLFGGNGFDSKGDQDLLNDLWEFNPSTTEWTWMGGLSTYTCGIFECDAPGQYGALGTPAAGNIPFGLYSASTWNGSGNSLWLFGGFGLDDGFSLNNLWNFNPSTTEWTWMDGVDSTTNLDYGVYGTLGIPAATNIPGGRQSAASWTDNSGNLWLFGGLGNSANTGAGYLNDLWVFSPPDNEWIWMGGNSSLGTGEGFTGVYGTLGTSAASNLPGSRLDGMSWTDDDGNLWLFGGYGFDGKGVFLSYLNDLWKYQPASIAPLPAAATPTFSVAAGTYTSAQSVTISDTTPGATIYYTTNGTTPTTSSTAATGPINVSSSQTIEAIATASGYTASAVASATYTIGQPAATPTFSPVAGTYTSAQTVTISDATAGATIYYTTNGTTPTTTSTLYTGPINVSSSETIEAIATASGYSNSAVATAAYTINLATQAATPTFSPAAGTYSSAQSVTISDTTPGATIYYTTNGTAPTTSSTVYSGPITVSASETLEAIATASSYSTSAVGTAAYTITSSTGATLVGAPNATGSYYGMFGTDLAAEFTLSTSANVTTIDVVVLGSGIYDFSLQNSLTGTITTFAQAVISAPNSGSNTEAMTVNATLPAGTYYLVGSKDATSTQTVPGWFVSDGTYLTNAGTVANGDWYSSSLTGPWTFESGVIGGITYVAPTFTVNGTATAQSTAATPTFSLASGSYTSAQTITISDATSGATIYYTTNGTTPTTSSTVYTGAITVSSSETLEAIATASGYSASAVASAAYIITSSGNGSVNEWTWMGGSSTVACNADGCSQPGVYGALGTPAQGNVPGGRQGAATWTDNSGNLWLFGGTGFDAGSNSGSLNDLWKFNPSTNLWAWMSGSKTVGSNGGQPGVYGTLGVAAAGNVPGGRNSAVSWTDSKGNLWLFGGLGFDSGGGTNDAARSVFLNDLWEFSPSTLEWTWMGGSSSMVCPSSSSDYCGQSGVYGTKGTSGAGDVPGGRYSATASTDSNGNFWLFGGYGYAAAGGCCYLNDLWEFNPTTDVWTWVTGGSGGEQAGVYGTKGTPAVGNAPGSRYYATSWFDELGNFWVYGGYGFDASSTGGYLDDLWEFNPSTNDWVWLAGSSSATCWSTEACPATAVYGTLGVPATADTPGNRSGASGWTDKSGNFWLFGSNAWQISGAIVTNRNLNDLWELNPSSQEWGWMSGISTPNTAGVYGILETPAAGNSPGGRSFASSWTDADGNLWLFGGSGLDADGNSGWLNDLWKYQPSTASLSPAATPTFSVAAGTYTSAQTVTISDATAGATIYYTTNGTAPTTSSTVYGGPITVSSSEMIEAIATATGYTASAVASAAYAINIPVAATPTFAPVAGTYTSAQSVSISDATAGATIYYTTNGTTPTTSSTIYSGAITVSSSETLEAIATASGYATSAVATAAYTIAPPAATPTFSPVAGTYTSAQSVTISDATSGATIYYTTNGTTPTTSSSVYSAAITVSSSETLEAIATASGYSTSAVASAAYTITPQAATPTFTPAAGTYTAAQSVTISDATAGATIYYTTNGTTPTTSSAVYSGAISVSSSETLEAIAIASGYSTSAVASAAYTITPQAATPTFTPAAGTYTAAQSLTISDATAGATIYYTTNGTSPMTSSAVYSGAISVSSSETLEAIATASGYSASAVATAVYTINIPTNPAPVISGMSPAFVTAGGTVFTLTVNGSGFAASSMVNWGATALTTTYVSTTQLTAQVPASDIASSGTTAITVQTPSPGGGTSNTLEFEVDSGSSGSGPTFTTVTATVTPGSTATYPVSLPSSASDVTVICLNLPAGASCSYSASSGSVTITTSASTPAGTYQITVVFTETLPGAATALIFMPILLLPLAWARRRWMRQHLWITACLGLVILAGAVGIGCGGGGGSSGGGSTTPQSHTVTSSGTVTLIVQ